MASMKFTKRPDGASQYITVDGDMIDMIGFAFYGTHDRTSELIYEANPHILGLDPVLPNGLTIILPAAPPEGRRVSTVSLWD